MAHQEHVGRRRPRRCSGADVSSCDSLHPSADRHSRSSVLAADVVSHCLAVPARFVFLALMRCSHPHSGLASIGEHQHEQQHEDASSRDSEVNSERELGSGGHALHSNPKPGSLSNVTTMLRNLGGPATVVASVSPRRCDGPPYLGTHSNENPGPAGVLSPSTGAQVMSQTRRAALVLSALVASVTLNVPQASPEDAEAPTPAPAHSEPAESHTTGLRIIYPTPQSDVEGGPDTTTTQPPPTTTTEAPQATQATTTTEAPPAVRPAGQGSGDPNDDASWYRLMECESGGKGWAVNTGNGYYGGLQFDLPSWRAAGGSGYPHQASAAEQIRRGRIWYEANGGWRSWPGCSRSFGWL